MFGLHIAFRPVAETVPRRNRECPFGATLRNDKLRCSTLLCLITQPAVPQAASRPGSARPGRAASTAHLRGGRSALRVPDFVSLHRAWAASLARAQKQRRLTLPKASTAILGATTRLTVLRHWSGDARF